jgi:hypothetical protein
MKPPAILDSHFDLVNNPSETIIKANVKILVEELVTYLNHENILDSLQGLRETVRQQAVHSLYPFSNRLRVEPWHWYIYNLGGRSEVQFNIGMNPHWFRIGLGFHLGNQRFGNPQMVDRTLSEFRTAVDNNRQHFQNFVIANDIQIHWTTKNGGWGIASNNAKYPQRVLTFLLNPTTKLANRGIVCGPISAGWSFTASVVHDSTVVALNTGGEPFSNFA